MKVQELFEAGNPKLAELIAKYGLKANRTLSQIDDFPFTDEHKEAFKAAGYELKWNGKKFEVISDETAASRQKSDDERFAVKNVTLRVPGFKPRRKMK